MFEAQGVKTMFDLHGLSVKEVKKLIEENFAKISQSGTVEIYLITGRGKHVNTNGTRGVLRKILPRLLKPYCQDILQVNPEMGAFKIILKPKQEAGQLKDLLMKLCVDKNNLTAYAKVLQQKAASNDIDALLALAIIHLNQAIKGFDNINKGISLLEKAKQLGSADAEVELGVLYHEGIIVKQRHEKAFKYFRSAANKNHPLGQYYLAVCYLHGKGVKYNDKHAVDWMKKAADQNDVYAQAELGNFYMLGEITTQDFELGIKYIKEAAKQGFVEAQIGLAKCYATGYGVERDYQKAFNYYLSAAQSNKPYAAYQVGSYLLTGRVGLRPDPTSAFPWFLKAAELGDADGQAQMAYLYLLGVGIERNFDKGIAWLHKAIKQKNIYGYYVAAMAYLKGLGVKQNGATAYKFMRQAAEGGYADAQYELGIMLFEGKSFFNNIPQNFDEALRWLEQAMERGNKEAAEIMQLFIEDERDAELISGSLKDKMQALLVIPNSQSVKPQSATTIKNAASVTSSSSASASFFKPVQKAVKQLKNNAQLTLQEDFYKFGRLGHMLVTISWYMTNEAGRKSFKQIHTLLYDEFKKWAEHIGVKPPQKKAKETLPRCILRYIENVMSTLEERVESPVSVYFITGFRMVGIEMIQFFNEGDQFDIVKELLDYLAYVHSYSQLVTIDSLYINKITATLYEQLKKPKKEFSSTEFIKKFELLEDELKLQLFSAKTLESSEEKIDFKAVTASRTINNAVQLDQLNNSLTVVNQTTADTKAQSGNLTPYSIWSKKTLSIGLATTAVIGVALLEREKIAKTAKSICKLQ